jgi:hypothetical protein
LLLVTCAVAEEWFRIADDHPALLKRRIVVTPVMPTQFALGCQLLLRPLVDAFIGKIVVDGQGRILAREESLTQARESRNGPSAW